MPDPRIAVLLVLKPEATMEEAEAVIKWAAIGYATSGYAKEYDAEEGEVVIYQP